MNPLILIGVILIPFFVWPGMDTREPKYLLAAILCGLIGLVALRSSSRPYRNIWVLAFLAFLPINFLLAPRIDIFVSGVPMASWILQADMYLGAFFLAHWGISNAVIDTQKILKAMMWTGTGMAVYAFLQRFRFEQFFIGEGMCGTFGNPAVLAAFLAFLVPIALYLRARWQAILMILVIFFIDSQVAYGSLFFSLLFLWGTRNRESKIFFTVVGSVVAATLVFGFFTSPKIRGFVGDSGRFDVWQKVVDDIRTPLVPGKAPYSLTGAGMGAFRYLFHTRHPKAGHNETFLEAHNDYIELLYNTGVVGLGLFLVALGSFVRSCYPLTRLKAHLLASFICISICAGGLFVWQNGAIIFYTIVITGVLVNDKTSGIKRHT